MGGVVRGCECGEDVARVVSVRGCEGGELRGW